MLTSTRLLFSNSLRADVPMTIPINTDIRLSEITADDEAACLEYLQGPEIYAVTLRIARPYTVTNFRSWLAILSGQRQQNGRSAVWAIRNRAGKMIGACGLDNYIPGRHLAEMGYWLAKPYWGQGIMTAVAGRICELGFGELGLEKIVAHTFAENAASARVLEKCGFRQEGYLRKHHRKDDRLIDARVFGRLKSD